jgi:hypothetical protein
VNIIYTIINQYGHLVINYTDYHDVIVYIRKNSIDNALIYESILNSTENVDISYDVYQHAYNGFKHFNDRNYE